MPPDAFPDTSGTWIVEKLDEGRRGRDEVNRHVMSVYAEPLKAYSRGTSDRWLGEPDDVVAGFFADRLARDDFFDGWRRSGARLRRWLMNGLCFYLHELRRSRRRDQRVEALAAEVPSAAGDPEEAFDRAFARAIVREALRETRRGCESEGLAKHWTAFFGHHYEGRPYREIAARLGVTPERAAVMARTACHRFKDTLRRLIAADGVAPRDIDDEIRSLLEVIDQ